MITRKNRKLLTLLSGGPLMLRQVYEAHEGEGKSAVLRRLTAAKDAGYADRARRAGGSQWGLTHAGYVVVRAMSLAQAELLRREGEAWAAPDPEPPPEPITPAFVPGSRPVFDRSGRLTGYAPLDDRPDLG